MRESRDDYNLLKHSEPEYKTVGLVVADVARKHSHGTAIQGLGRSHYWCGHKRDCYLSPLARFHARKVSIGEAYDADEDEAFEDSANVNLVWVSGRCVSTHYPERHKMLTFHIKSQNH